MPSPPILVILLYSSGGIALLLLFPERQMNARPPVCISNKSDEEIYINALQHQNTNKQSTYRTYFECRKWVDRTWNTSIHKSQWDDIERKNIVTHKHMTHSCQCCYRSGSTIEQEKKKCWAASKHWMAKAIITTTGKRNTEVTNWCFYLWHAWPNIVFINIKPDPVQLLYTAQMLFVYVDTYILYAPKLDVDNHNFFSSLSRSLFSSLTIALCVSLFCLLLSCYFETCTLIELWIYFCHIDREQAIEINLSGINNNRKKKNREREKNGR